MPYFQFRSPANAAVEVGGNTEAEVTAALERSAAVANKALARAWVHAFFARRAHAIAKQKAEQAGDEDAADQVPRAPPPPHSANAHRCSWNRQGVLTCLFPAPYVSACL